MLPGFSLVERRRVRLPAVGATGNSSGSELGSNRDGPPQSTHRWDRGRREGRETRRVAHTRCKPALHP
jgi:hypothetical protein